VPGVYVDASRQHLGRPAEPLPEVLVVVEQEERQGRGPGLAEAESGRRYLRISTPIGPLAGTDPERCLRFNWAQRCGFLAVADLDGAPCLHLYENRPYELLDEGELHRVIVELGRLGDQLEQLLALRSDTF